MSFAAILETLLIGPLKLVFEFIFQFGMLFTGNATVWVIPAFAVLAVLLFLLLRPIPQKSGKLN